MFSNDIAVAVLWDQSFVRNTLINAVRNMLMLGFYIRHEVASWMALARILRCHPLGTHGLDFVPAQLPPRAHWYAPWRYGRWRGTNETPP